MSRSGYRRGYDFFIKVNLALAGASILVLFYNWMLGLALVVWFLLAFITLEGVSAPPVNGPANFHAYKKSKEQPTLVCLGDDHVNGNIGASLTADLAARLCQALGLPLPPPTAIFCEPLWVVNAGQNCTSIEVLLKEQLHTALSCHPDFILIWIGLHDVMAMCDDKYAKQLSSIHGRSLTRKPSLASFEQYLVAILDYLEQASPMTKVGLATLAPIGEDLQSKTNKVVQQVNSIIVKTLQNRRDSRNCSLVPIYDRFESIIEKSSRRRGNIWFNPLGRLSSPLAFLSQVVAVNAGMLVSRNTLTTLTSAGTNTLLYDSLHLNERASAVACDVIVDWLISANVAKAIAVKRSRPDVTMSDNDDDIYNTYNDDDDSDVGFDQGYKDD